MSTPESHGNLGLTSEPDKLVVEGGSIDIYRLGSEHSVGTPSRLKLLERTEKRVAGRDRINYQIENVVGKLLGRLGF
jgi:hypothetical protein